MLLTRYGLYAAFFFSSWWLWVSPLSFHDAVVGMLCTANVVPLVAVAERQYPPRFFPRFKWVKELSRVPMAIVSDAGRVLLHLVLRLGRGEAIHPVYEMPFKSGAAHYAPAKRAVAVTLSTLSPNSVTIDVNDERALVHQLHPGPRPGALERLGRA